MFFRICFIQILFFSCFYSFGQEKPNEKVLNLAVIGLVHDHVNWIFNRQKKDIKIVGIVETNLKAKERYKKRYNIPENLFYDSYQLLYNELKPDAVSAFNTTKGHLDVVRFFAPKGVPIMVEKPLATTLKDAEEMASLSKKYNTPLIVNYETSWYDSTYAAKNLLINGNLGRLTKMIFNTGHPGPKEIGCTPEFLSWLTDPFLNGGGALLDFGCYGANIATWILDGQTPINVTCITKQIKPNLYPNVDDDTTIILEYKEHKAIIQASWNWSHNRKDMQLYGTKGYINCKNATNMLIMKNEIGKENKFNPKPVLEYQKDPFRLLYEVVFNNLKLEPYSLYSLENNLIVSKILSLAKKSAETKKTQIW